MNNKLYAAWAGFVGGNVASFVKWGTENPLPPRSSDRAIPPAEMLNDIGLNVQSMTYTYSGHVINWGIAGVHHLFSLFFAMFYCVVAERFPKITLWQGAAFAIVLTILFHGIMLPVFGWAPSFWDLPLDEIISETLGHILWMWVIEVFRQYILKRV
ncbi:MAG: YagU family protein [Marinomonas sp.]